MIENIPPTKGALTQHVFSDQSFNLQSSDSLSVKTLMAGMLANGIGRK